MVSTSITAPVFIDLTAKSSMACMTAGTPARTNTLPMRKPGAREIGFSMRSAPRGMARHAAARGCKIGCGVALKHDRDRSRILADGHAKGAPDRIGGDVVVGWTDAS